MEWTIAKWIFLNLLEILSQPVQGSLTYAFSRLVCRCIFPGNSTWKSVCVVANETVMFILLLHISINCNEALHCRQNTVSSRDSITYHNITEHSSHLEQKICGILPSFHVLYGSYLTKVLYGRYKINSFEILPSKLENVDLMSWMRSYYANIEKATYFVLQHKTSYFLNTHSLQLLKEKEISMR